MHNDSKQAGQLQGIAYLVELTLGMKNMIIKQIHGSYMKKYAFSLFLIMAMMNCFSQPVRQHGQLKVTGTQLTDQQGNPVVLRGVSYGWHCFWPRFYNAGSVQWLKNDWNATVVRAALGVEPGENSYLKRPEWSKEKIMAVVDAAIKEDIYVIIDWHSHNINLKEAKAFFAEMADKYGKYPHVIYEIFNEPDEESWAEVKAYSAEIIKVIRAADPDNIILVGSPHWDQDLHIVADDPLQGFSNLMYTLHFYAATHKQGLRDRGDYALRKGIPIFISESAGMEASGDGPLNPEEWQKWINWAEQHKISWITWSVSDKNETCSVLLPSASAEGNWKEGDLKESGIRTRALLKKYNNNLAVIAYYSGDASRLSQYPVEKLTHIIFSFCHLKGNRLHVNNARDTATIRELVAAKKRNPGLKVMLSLGGWGGCETCSVFFSTDGNRKAFASSVKELDSYFNTDGIDLDWEYPTIPGYPGHAYSAADKNNFTALVKTLRDTLGSKQEISFAAGGTDPFLLNSVDWKSLGPLVDRINLMSYDLVSGFSTVTGHHTPLYSTSKQSASADHAIRYLDSIGVPLNKIVIGAAFYARTWESVENVNNGLYQQGKFKSFVPYRQFSQQLNSANGYQFYYDSVANAAYAYSVQRKEFATFDDPVSIQLKTAYAIKKGLNGIMFWELTLDKPQQGLVDVIDKEKNNK